MPDRTARAKGIFRYQVNFAASASAAEFRIAGRLKA
jgi:hypothetical protein